MNNRQQHTWWLTFSKFQKSRESTWAPKIHQQLRKQIAVAIPLIQEYGIDGAIARIGGIIPMEGIGKVIRNIYIDAGRVFGQMAYQMVKQQMVNISLTKKYLNEAVSRKMTDEDIELFNKLFDDQKEKRLSPIGFNEELVNEIIRHYQLDLLSRAVIPITETTRDQILQTLIKAQRESLSIQQVVNRLESPELTRYRARMIARTETNKSANWAAVRGARKTGYADNMQKVWISARDQRTRRTPRDEFDHLNMNGIRVGINEPFQVPKKDGGYELMQQPGDTAGSAGNVIHCRCTVGFKVVRGATGRPVRQSEQFTNQ